MGDPAIFEDRLISIMWKHSTVINAIPPPCLSLKECVSRRSVGQRNMLEGWFPVIINLQPLIPEKWNVFLPIGGANMLDWICSPDTDSGVALIAVLCFHIIKMSLSSKIAGSQKNSCIGIFVKFLPIKCLRIVILPSISRAMKEAGIALLALGDPLRYLGPYLFMSTWSGWKTRYYWSVTPFDQEANPYPYRLWT